MEKHDNEKHEDKQLALPLSKKEYDESSEQEYETIDAAIAHDELKQRPDWSKSSATENRLTIEAIAARIAERHKMSAPRVVPDKEVSSEGVYVPELNSFVMKAELFSHEEPRPALRSLFQVQRQAVQYVVIEAQANKELFAKHGKALLVNELSIVCEETQQLWHAQAEIYQRAGVVDSSKNVFRQDALVAAVRRLDAFDRQQMEVLEARELKRRYEPDKDVSHRISELATEVEKEHERDKGKSI